MANTQTLANQILLRLNNGFPNADSRFTQGQIETLVKQIAPGVMRNDYEQSMKLWGARNVNGQFVKPYTISLTSGGTNWKKAQLTAPYIALPFSRGIAYVLTPDGTIIEPVDKATFLGLAGGLLQETGKYFAIPLSDYIEIRTSCNKRLPPLSTVEVGQVVPDESLVNEVYDAIIIEKAMAILVGEGMPDKNVNANPA